MKKCLEVSVRRDDGEDKASYRTAGPTALTYLGSPNVGTDRISIVACTAVDVSPFESPLLHILPTSERTSTYQSRISYYLSSIQAPTIASEQTDYFL